MCLLHISYNLTYICYSVYWWSVSNSFHAWLCTACSLCTHLAWCSRLVGCTNRWSGRRSTCGEPSSACHSATPTLSGTGVYCYTLILVLSSIPQSLTAGRHADIGGYGSVVARYRRIWEGQCIRSDEPAAAAAGSIFKRTKTLTQQFTIPVNTTRIILGLREGGTPTLAVNRELLGRTAGKLGHDGDGNGRITSASITLAGQVLPQPAYQIDAKDGKIIRPWSDWQGFLKSSIGNTAGAQNLSEFEDDMLLAFRIMGARDSVAQNLTTRLNSAKGSNSWSYSDIHSGIARAEVVVKDG
eukprot:COSAG03_NODE_5632_length_1205_cov_1.204340_1_plen_297_part_10